MRLVPGRGRLQLLCWMRGHDSIVKFEKDRIYLECLSCGYTSAGWPIGEIPQGRTRREPEAVAKGAIVRNRARGNVRAGARFFSFVR